MHAVIVTRDAYNSLTFQLKFALKFASRSKCDNSTLFPSHLRIFCTRTAAVATCWRQRHEFRDCKQKCDASENAQRVCTQEINSTHKTVHFYTFNHCVFVLRYQFNVGNKL